MGLSGIVYNSILAWTRWVVFKWIIADCALVHHRVVKEHMELIHGGETKLEDRLKRLNALTADRHLAYRKRQSED